MCVLSEQTTATGTKFSKLINSDVWIIKDCEHCKTTPYSAVCQHHIDYLGKGAIEIKKCIAAGDDKEEFAGQIKLNF